MVHLEARGAGNYSPWLCRILLGISLHPEDSLNLWWAVISATLCDLEHVVQLAWGLTSFTYKIRLLIGPPS